jgi:cytochrome c peroxidase
LSLTSWQPDEQIMHILPRDHRDKLALGVGAVLFGFLAVALYLWQWPQPSERSHTRVARASARLISEPIEPILPLANLDPRKVDLGRQLFHDPQLSSDGKVACATCHDLRRGGTDQRDRPLGLGGSHGDFNAPTVFNSAANFRQFWDGRAGTLEEQIDGPIHSAMEMGTTWPDVVGRLGRSSTYGAAFEQIYPDRITGANVKDAIAAFERSLNTPNSRFDRHLLGDASALTADEEEGYRLFKAYGCVSCHQGTNIGGNMFQRMGIAVDYFGSRPGVTEADLGRYRITGDERDRHVFKVPSLRNVALTAPYFHDGSAPTLETAVALMGLHQLGRELSGRDVALIVQFLQTLTGEYQGAPLQ